MSGPCNSRRIPDTSDFLPPTDSARVLRAEAP
jgi:hypothetical protein